MIVDTSVFVDALIAGPRTASARSFFGSTANVVAPDIIMVEIAAVLTRAVRRQMLSAFQARTVFARARRIGPELEPTGPLLGRAFEMSLELDHPVADCIFLVQAEASADVLVTCDSRFARKVAASPYARSIIDLSDWQPSTPS